MLAVRIILAILAGLLGAIAGWIGLAYLLIVTSGPDRDGGIEMGAFFGLGPIGGIIGFAAGVGLFLWKGIVREKPQPPVEHPFTGVSNLQPPRKTRISRPFTVVLVLILAGLAWGAWYEFIRSPYLTHGAEAEMTLAMQFRLPPGMKLPEHSDGIDVEVKDGSGRAFMTFGEEWFGPKWFRQDGDRQVLLASAELDMITYWRDVRLTLPGMPEQTWTLGLSADPYPIPAYTEWHAADNASGPKIEMRFKLTADRCSVCAFNDDPAQ